MPLDDANAFWKRVHDDHEFRHKLTTATSDLELGAILIDAGFAVTAQELADSLDAWKQASSGRELADNELENVAGGGVGDRLPSLTQIHAGLKLVQPIGFKG